MKMKKFKNDVWGILRVFFVIFCCLTWGFPAYGLPEQGHTALANKYIWGLTTEASKNIHSAIIDKVPWRNSTGTMNHRELWGHSDDWFYKGKLPKEAVLKDICRVIGEENPQWTVQEVEKYSLKRYRELVSQSGQERIAEELQKHFSFLSRKEAMAVAEQAHAAHIVGDAKTAEGAKLNNIHRVQDTLRHPPLEAISAENKMNLDFTMRNVAMNGKDFSPAVFIGGAPNFERLKVEGFMRDQGLKMYNPPNKENIGVVFEGRNYLYKMDHGDIRKALTQANNSELRIILPDDEYNKFISNSRNADIVDRVIPESMVTGKSNTIKNSQLILQNEVQAKADEIAASQKDFIANVRKSIISKAAPYMLGGAIMAISGNWDVLNAAYQGEEEWEKALKRTATDFAGYTVTPMMIDGVLAKAGNNVAVMVPLKNAGLGYTIGYFAWGSGKEYFTFQTGDITYEEMLERLENRGKGAVAQGAMIPANMLVLKIFGGGAAWVVPVVIISGGYVWQRGTKWYQNKIWEQTVYMDDVLAILGPDLVEDFTLLTPERRDSLAEPERRFSFAEPERRDSLAEPERRSNFLDP
jgi:hypothetical protein